MEIQEMLDGWNRGDGKPMKGSLIDMRGWENGEGICAMCAQGQALHLIGGMSPEDINDLEQRNADTKVMKILGIPRGQAILLRNINDSTEGAPAIVIAEPEKVLGDNAQAVLAFFKYIDSLDNEGWQKVDAAWDAAWDAAGAAAWAAAGAAAGDAAGAAAGDAAGAAAGTAAWAAAGTAAWAAARAANEIQGASILEKASKPLFFLSMFGFKTVQALLDAVQS